MAADFELRRINIVDSVYINGDFGRGNPLAKRLDAADFAKRMPYRLLIEKIIG